MRIERPGQGDKERDYRHLQSVPSSQFQYVDITFAEANVDVVIPHALRPLYPEDINWQVVRVEAPITHVVGKFVDVPFNAANFSAVGGGTWVVTAQNVYSYAVEGNKMTLAVETDNSTVAGIVNQLQVAVPGGFAPAKVGVVAGAVWLNGAGVGEMGMVWTPGVALALLDLYRPALAAYPNGSYRVGFTATFEVVPTTTPATNTVPNIYRDAAVTRRAFGDGYVVLRSTVAGAKVRLLLTVEQE